MLSTNNVTNVLTQLAKIAMVTGTIAANTNDTQPQFNKSQEPVSNVNKQNVINPYFIHNVA